MFFKPQLPMDVREMRLIGVSYLGNRLDVVYDSSSVLISVQAASRVSIRGRLLSVHGLAVVDLSTNKTYPLSSSNSVKLSVTASGFLVQHA
jgi:hypothetical protein